MNVTISVGGSFPAAYHYGRYLEEEGRLIRLLNPLPYSRTKRFGVSQERTKSLWVLGGCHYLNNLYAPANLYSRNQHALHVAFDHAVARQLGDPDIINVWASNGLATIRRGHRLGLRAVLHTGSTHIVRQTEILREEFRRFGFDGALTRSDLVQRTVTEYDEADAIVVPSQIVYDSFVEMGVPSAKLHVVPWGGKSVTDPPAEPRESKATQVLFVGNCSLRKGVPYLFEAFRALRGRANLRLVGPTSERVFECAGGIPDGVQVSGPLRGEGLAQAYRDADVFVLPSIEEGSAFVIMEAMAAGLPVVVSDRAGADQVQNNVNGFVVPARDSAALAAKLEELVANRDLRERIGEAAAASVLERDWRTYGKDLDERVFRPLYNEEGTGR